MKMKNFTMLLAALSVGTFANAQDPVLNNPVKDGHMIIQWDYANGKFAEDVNFEIHDHEKIAIIGRNGCGKTTILFMLWI